MCYHIRIAFFTVNHWENGLFESAVMARKLLKMYCIERGMKQKLIDAIDMPKGAT